VASDLGFGAALDFGVPWVGLCSGKGSGGAAVSLGGVGLASCLLDADCFSLALLVRQPRTSSNMAMTTQTGILVRMTILQSKAWMERSL
jgi:hypothetical protein